MELHLGLTIDQERQLFHDLNALGYKVSKSIVMNFNQTNLFETYIKNELIPKTNFKIQKFKNKSDNECDFDLAAFVKLCAVIVFGKSSGRYEDREPDELESNRLIKFLTVIENHKDFRNRETFMRNVGFIYQLAFAFIQQSSLEMQMTFLQKLNEFSPTKDPFFFCHVNDDEKQFFVKRLNKKDCGFRCTSKDVLTIRLILKSIEMA